MKKKLLSMLAAISIIFSAVVFAAQDSDNAPVVEIDGRRITFADQQPVILADEGRTMVPARGVFEFMGARVDWDEDKRLVTINSQDNITRILITIDNPIMTVYTFTSVLSADKSEITLDAAPRIINDRTMIPLRAISETLKATVEWEESTRTVSIFSKDYVPQTARPTRTPAASSNPLESSSPKASSAPNATDDPSTGSITAPDASRSPANPSGTFDPADVEVYLSVSNNKPRVGDTIDVYLNVDGIDGAFNSNEGVTGVTVTFEYDKNVLEYVDNSFKCNTTANITSIVNPEYDDKRLKAVGIFVDTDKAMRNDGELVRLSFKVLSENTTSLILSDGVDVSVGYDTFLIYDKNGETKSIKKYLNVDKTPVIIN